MISASADSLSRIEPETSLEPLLDFIQARPKLLVLTGAGCSTESGIPDYRDDDGEWKCKPPLRFQEFVGSEAMRKRYWARSLVGFELVREAAPNEAHVALARLEAMGKVHHLVTQNVDGLHQKAGSRKVVDLHGRLDIVRCLSCGEASSRLEFQTRLEDVNPGWTAIEAGYAPDGDADLEGVDFAMFRIPDCARCGGILKPDVVFFGESVPRDRVTEAMSRVDEAEGLLVVGSSLMVWSGYRFVRRAVQLGIPVAAVNLGRTRADGEITLKVRADCTTVLPRLVERLRPTAPSS